MSKQCKKEQDQFNRKNPVGDLKKCKYCEHCKECKMCMHWTGCNHPQWCEVGCETCTKCVHYSPSRSCQYCSKCVNNPNPILSYCEQCGVAKYCSNCEDCNPTNILPSGIRESFRPT